MLFTNIMTFILGAMLITILILNNKLGTSLVHSIQIKTFSFTVDRILFSIARFQQISYHAQIKMEGDTDIFSWINPLPPFHF